MAVLALIALLLGVLCGRLGGENALFAALVSWDGVVLNLLMVSVGISIGQQAGILQKIRQYHFKALIIPLGVTVGSLGAGLAGALLLAIRWPKARRSPVVWAGIAWAAPTIGALSGGLYGSVAFLSNLLREILSFFGIPLLARFLNPAACIAAAGATSEDTTLPMMMKYTDEESVVLSVLNGAICSVLVPVLINACYRFLG